MSVKNTLDRNLGTLPSLPEGPEDPTQRQDHWNQLYGQMIGRLKRADVSNRDARRLMRAHFSWNKVKPWSLPTAARHAEFARVMTFVMAREIQQSGTISTSQQRELRTLADELKLPFPSTTPSTPTEKAEFAQALQQLVGQLHLKAAETVAKQFVGTSAASFNVLNVNASAPFKIRDRVSLEQAPTATPSTKKAPASATRSTKRATTSTALTADVIDTTQRPAPADDRRRTAARTPAPRQPARMPALGSGATAGPLNLEITLTSENVSRWATVVDKLRQDPSGNRYWKDMYQRLSNAGAEGLESFREQIRLHERGGITSDALHAVVQAAVGKALTTQANLRVLAEDYGHKKGATVIERWTVLTAMAKAKGIVVQGRRDEPRVVQALVEKLFASAGGAVDDAPVIPARAEQRARERAKEQARREAAAAAVQAAQDARNAADTRATTMGLGNYPVFATLGAEDPGTRYAAWQTVLMMVDRAGYRENDWHGWLTDAGFGRSTTPWRVAAASKAHGDRIKAFLGRVIEELGATGRPNKVSLDDAEGVLTALIAASVDAAHPGVPHPKRARATWQFAEDAGFSEGKKEIPTDPHAQRKMIADVAFQALQTFPDRSSDNTTILALATLPESGWADVIELLAKSFETDEGFVPKRDIVAAFTHATATDPALVADGAARQAIDQQADALTTAEDEPFRDQFAALVMRLAPEARSVFFDAVIDAAAETRRIGPDRLEGIPLSRFKSQVRSLALGYGVFGFTDNMARNVGADDDAVRRYPHPCDAQTLQSLNAYGELLPADALSQDGALRNLQLKPNRPTRGEFNVAERRATALDGRDDVWNSEMFARTMAALGIPEARFEQVRAEAIADNTWEAGRTYDVLVREAQAEYASRLFAAAEHDLRTQLHLQHAGQAIAADIAAERAAKFDTTPVTNDDVRTRFFESHYQQKPFIPNAAKMEDLFESRYRYTRKVGHEEVAGLARVGMLLALTANRDVEDSELASGPHVDFEALRATLFKLDEALGDDSWCRKFLVTTQDGKTASRTSRLTVGELRLIQATLARGVFHGVASRVALNAWEQNDAASAAITDTDRAALRAAHRMWTGQSRIDDNALGAMALRDGGLRLLQGYAAEWAVTPPEDTYFVARVLSRFQSLWIQGAKEALAKGQGSEATVLSAMLSSVDVANINTNPVGTDALHEVTGNWSGADMQFLLTKVLPSLRPVEVKARSRRTASGTATPETPAASTPAVASSSDRIYFEAESDILSEVLEANIWFDPSPGGRGLLDELDEVAGIRALVAQRAITLPDGAEWWVTTTELEHPQRLDDVKRAALWRTIWSEVGLRLSGTDDPSNLKVRAFGQAYTTALAVSRLHSTHPNLVLRSKAGEDDGTVLFAHAVALELPIVRTRTGLPTELSARQILIQDIANALEAEGIPTANTSSASRLTGGQWVLLARDLIAAGHEESVRAVYKIRNGGVEFAGTDLATGFATLAVQHPDLAFGELDRALIVGKDDEDKYRARAFLRGMAMFYTDLQSGRSMPSADEQGDVVDLADALGIKDAASVGDRVLPSAKREGLLELVYTIYRDAVARPEPLTVGLNGIGAATFELAQVDTNRSVDWSSVERVVGDGLVLSLRTQVSQIVGNLGLVEWFKANPEDPAQPRNPAQPSPAPFLEGVTEANREAVATLLSAFRGSLIDLELALRTGTPDLVRQAYVKVHQQLGILRQQLDTSHGFAIESAQSQVQAIAAHWFGTAEVGTDGALVVGSRSSAPTEQDADDQHVFLVTTLEVAQRQLREVPYPGEAPDEPGRLRFFGRLRRDVMGSVVSGAHAASGVDRRDGAGQVRTSSNWDAVRWQDGEPVRVAAYHPADARLLLAFAEQANEGVAKDVVGPRAVTEEVNHAVTRVVVPGADASDREVSDATFLPVQDLDESGWRAVFAYANALSGNLKENGITEVSLTDEQREKLGLDLETTIANGDAPWLISARARASDGRTLADGEAFGYVARLVAALEYQLDPLAARSADSALMTQRKAQVRAMILAKVVEEARKSSGRGSAYALEVHDVETMYRAIYDAYLDDPDALGFDPDPALNASRIDRLGTQLLAQSASGEGPLTAIAGMGFDKIDDVNQVHPVAAGPAQLIAKYEQGLLDAAQDAATALHAARAESDDDKRAHKNEAAESSLRTLLQVYQEDGLHALAWIARGSKSDALPPESNPTPRDHMMAALADARAWEAPEGDPTTPAERAVGDISAHLLNEGLTQQAASFLIPFAGRYGTDNPISDIFRNIGSPEAFEAALQRLAQTDENKAFLAAYIQQFFRTYEDKETVLYLYDYNKFDVVAETRNLFRLGGDTVPNTARELETAGATASWEGASSPEAIIQKFVRLCINQHNRDDNDGRGDKDGVSNEFKITPARENYYLARVTMPVDANGAVSAAYERGHWLKHGRGTEHEDIQELLRLAELPIEDFGYGEDSKTSVFAALHLVHDASDSAKNRRGVVNAIRERLSQTSIPASHHDAIAEGLSRGLLEPGLDVEVRNQTIAALLSGIGEITCDHDKKCEKSDECHKGELLTVVLQRLIVPIQNRIDAHNYELPAGAAKLPGLDRKVLGPLMTGFHVDQVATLAEPALATSIIMNDRPADRFAGQIQTKEPRAMVQAMRDADARTLASLVTLKPDRIEGLIVTVDDKLDTLTDTKLAARFTGLGFRVPSEAVATLCMLRPDSPLAKAQEKVNKAIETAKAGGIEWRVYDGVPIQLPAANAELQSALRELQFVRALYNMSDDGQPMGLSTAGRLFYDMRRGELNPQTLSGIDNIGLGFEGGRRAFRQQLAVLLSTTAYLDKRDVQTGEEPGPTREALLLYGLSLPEPSLSGGIQYRPDVAARILTGVGEAGALQSKGAASNDRADLDALRRANQGVAHIDKCLETALADLVGKDQGLRLQAMLLHSNKTGAIADMLRQELGQSADWLMYFFSNAHGGISSALGAVGIGEGRWAADELDARKSPLHTSLERFLNEMQLVEMELEWHPGREMTPEQAQRVHAAKERLVADWQNFLRAEGASEEIIEQAGAMVGSAVLGICAMAATSGMAGFLIAGTLSGAGMVGGAQLGRTSVTGDSLAWNEAVGYFGEGAAYAFLFPQGRAVLGSVAGRIPLLGRATSGLARVPVLGRLGAGVAQGVVGVNTAQTWRRFWMDEAFRDDVLDGDIGALGGEWISHTGTGVAAGLSIEVLPWLFGVAAKGALSPVAGAGRLTAAGWQRIRRGFRAGVMLLPRAPVAVARLSGQVLRVPALVGAVAGRRGMTALDRVFGAPARWAGALDRFLVRTVGHHRLAGLANMSPEMMDDAVRIAARTDVPPAEERALLEALFARVDDAAGAGGVADDLGGAASHAPTSASQLSPGQVDDLIVVLREAAEGVRPNQNPVAQAQQWQTIGDAAEILRRAGRSLDDLPAETLTALRGAFNRTRGYRAPNTGSTHNQALATELRGTMGEALGRLDDGGASGALRNTFSQLDGLQQLGAMCSFEQGRHLLRVVAAGERVMAARGLGQAIRALLGGQRGAWQRARSHAPLREGTRESAHAVLSGRNTLDQINGVVRLLVDDVPPSAYANNTGRDLLAGVLREFADTNNEAAMRSLLHNLRRSGVRLQGNLNATDEAVAQTAVNDMARQLCAGGADEGIVGRVLQDAAGEIEPAVGAIRTLEPGLWSPIENQVLQANVRRALVWRGLRNAVRNNTLDEARVERLVDLGAARPTGAVDDAWVNSVVALDDDVLRPVFREVAGDVGDVGRLGRVTADLDIETHCTTVLRELGDDVGRTRGGTHTPFGNDGPPLQRWRAFAGQFDEAVPGRVSGLLGGDELVAARATNLGQLATRSDDALIQTGTLSGDDAARLRTYAVELADEIQGLRRAGNSWRASAATRMSGAQQAAHARALQAGQRRLDLVLRRLRAAERVSGAEQAGSFMALATAARNDAELLIDDLTPTRVAERLDPDLRVRVTNAPDQRQALLAMLDGDDASRVWAALDDAQREAFGFSRALARVDDWTADDLRFILGEAAPENAGLDQLRTAYTSTLNAASGGGRHEVNMAAAGVLNRARARLPLRTAIADTAHAAGWMRSTLGALNRREFDQAVLRPALNDMAEDAIMAACRRADDAGDFVQVMRSAFGEASGQPNWNSLRAGLVGTGDDFARARAELRGFLQGASDDVHAGLARNDLVTEQVLASWVNRNFAIADRALLQRLLGRLGRRHPLRNADLDNLVEHCANQPSVGQVGNAQRYLPERLRTFGLRMVRFRQVVANRDLLGRIQPHGPEYRALCRQAQALDQQLAPEMRRYMSTARARNRRLQRELTAAEEAGTTATATRLRGELDLFSRELAEARARFFGDAPFGAVAAGQRGANGMVFGLQGRASATRTGHLASRRWTSGSSIRGRSGGDFIVTLNEFRRFFAQQSWSVEEATTRAMRSAWTAASLDAVRDPSGGTNPALGGKSHPSQRGKVPAFTPGEAPTEPPKPRDVSVPGLGTGR